MVAVTGLHRKAAIRLLRRVPRTVPTPPRAGRPRRYGAPVAAAAEVLWQASGRIGAHRLHPFVPELLDRLLPCGELTITPAVNTLVRQGTSFASVAGVKNESSGGAGGPRGAEGPS